MTRREKIEALRRLAGGTPYQAERDAALAKANELEQLERLFGDADTEHDFPTFDEAMRDNPLNRWMELQAIRAAEEALGAVAWDEGHWVIPGRPPLLDKAELFRLYAEGVE